MKLIRTVFRHHQINPTHISSEFFREFSSRNFTVKELSEILSKTEISMTELTYVLLSKERLVWEKYFNGKKPNQLDFLPLIDLIKKFWPEMNNRQKIETCLFLYKMREKSAVSIIHFDTIKKTTEEIKKLIFSDYFLDGKNSLYFLNCMALGMQTEFADSRTFFIQKICLDDFESFEPFLNEFGFKSLFKLINLTATPEFKKDSQILFESSELLAEKMNSCLTENLVKNLKEWQNIIEGLVHSLSFLCDGKKASNLNILNDHFFDLTKTKSGKKFEIKEEEFEEE